jgi:hypothetical protein
MDEQPPSRAAAFEDEIRPRDGLRVSLGELRTPLDKFESAPAVESVEAAGSLLEAY